MYHLFTIRLIKFICQRNNRIRTITKMIIPVQLSTTILASPFYYPTPRVLQLRTCPTPDAKETGTIRFLLSCPRPINLAFPAPACTLNSTPKHNTKLPFPGPDFCAIFLHSEPDSPSRPGCGRLRGLGRPRLLESCRSLSTNLADQRVLSIAFEP